ncbi:MAG: isoprenylcysteine carboxylmethyltransferase family protein [Verrucomicrobiota bacterium]
MERGNDSFAARGGWWVVAQGVLLLAVVGLPVAERRTNGGATWASDGLFLLGAVLFALGGWLGIAGVRDLGINRTAYPRPKDHGTLIQTGAYGLVRHPLYGSLVLASFGWGLLWNSWPVLVAAALLTVLLNAKASVEERWLLQKYPEYESYRHRVKRLLPWVW